MVIAYAPTPENAIALLPFQAIKEKNFTRQFCLCLVLEGFIPGRERYEENRAELRGLTGELLRRRHGGRRR